MSTPAPTAEPTQPADPADDDYQQALRILLDTGLALVQEIAADPSLSPAAKAEPYDRLARSIRRTIALARHIAENPPKRTQSPADRRTQSRRQIIRDVENAIHRQVDRPEQVESLRGELDERLDDPEFDHDLATRPIPDIILDLKCDLGLQRNIDGGYNRRTPAAIRTLNARAASTPQPPPDPEPEFAYRPGQTRPNPLLTRYREAADG